MTSALLDDAHLQHERSPKREAPDRGAVAYVRVSTDKQLAGSGTDRQRRAIEAYAGAAGIKILEVFEESHSATDSTPLQDRPEWARAVDLALRRGCPILVERFDRLSRNMQAYDEWRRRYPVTVIAVTEEDVFQTPGERARIAAAAADADAKAAGQAATYARMRAEGRPIGNPKPSPLAHQKSADSRRHFARLRHLKIVGVLEELGHDLPRPALVRVLNERGILSSTGKPWTPGLLAYDHKKALEILRGRAEASVADNAQDEADRIEMEKNPQFGMF